MKASNVLCSSIDSKRTNLGLSCDQFKRASEFLEEQAWSQGSVLIPPLGCIPDLSLGMPNDYQAEAQYSTLEFVQQLPAIDNLPAFGLSDGL